MEISQEVAHEVPQNHCTAALQEYQISVNEKINFNNYNPQSLIIFYIKVIQTRNHNEMFLPFSCLLLQMVRHIIISSPWRTNDVHKMIHI
jgi:hypothetical protein